VGAFGGAGFWHFVVWGRGGGKFVGGCGVVMGVLEVRRIALDLLVVG